MFGKILDSVCDTVDNLIYDPLGTTAAIVLQPVRGAADILEGFTEGELRQAAALRLGADVAAGMALSEVVDLFVSD